MIYHVEDRQRGRKRRAHDVLDEKKNGREEMFECGILRELA